MPEAKTAEHRSDGMSETSINWEDNADVVPLTFADKVNSANGVVRLTRRAIEYTAKTALVANGLSAERRGVHGNKHHGNILFTAKWSAGMKKMVADALALDSSSVDPKNPSPPDGLS